MRLIAFDLVTLQDSHHINIPYNLCSSSNHVVLKSELWVDILQSDFILCVQKIKHQVLHNTMIKFCFKLRHNASELVPKFQLTRRLRYQEQTFRWFKAFLECWIFLKSWLCQEGHQFEEMIKMCNKSEILCDLTTG